MKKRNKLVIFSILIISLIISGCGAKNQDAALEEELTEQVKEEKQEKLMKEYENLIILADKEIENLVKFIDDNIEDLDKESADIVMLGLEEKLKLNSESVKNSLLELDLEDELKTKAAGELFFQENRLSEIENEELKDYLKDVFKLYYKIMLDEDDIHLYIDYDKLLKYDDHISERLISYMSLKADEINNPLVKDGEILVSYEELENRIIRIENYLKRFKDIESQEEIFKCYRDNLTIYMRGTEKTPIYEESEEEKARRSKEVLAGLKDRKPNNTGDQEGVNNPEGSKRYRGKINQDLLASYENMAKDKDKTSSHIIRKYLDHIKSNDLMIEEDIELTILELIGEALNILEENVGEENI